MREILVIIGVVLIALILWDGLRRMQKKGRYADDYEDPEEARKKAEIARELPNGGARVRPMDSRDQTDLNTRLNLRERVPMLMDPVDDETPVSVEPDVHADQQALDFDAPAVEIAEPEQNFSSAAVDNDQDDAFEDDDAYEDDQDEDVIAETSAEFDDDGSDKEESDVTALADDDWNEPHFGATDEALSQEPPDERPVEELVIIHVMATEGDTLAGSELLELMLRAGLRFGPMDIFHYRNGQGQLEFSLANCVQPGTLDPDAMAELTTPGVTLFMQLPQRADLMTSFDHMVEMAQFLAQQLNADMLDENHSTVTAQRIEHYRERLRNFARSQLIQAHE